MHLAQPPTELHYTDGKLMDSEQKGNLGSRSLFIMLNAARMGLVRLCKK